MKSFAIKFRRRHGRDTPVHECRAASPEEALAYARSWADQLRKGGSPVASIILYVPVIEEPVGSNP